MQQERSNEFTAIVSIIKQSQANAVKAINKELLNLYWNVGAYISKQVLNAVWGDKTVSELAEFILKNEPGIKGFDRRGLYRMKQFYEVYSQDLFVSSTMTQIQDIDKQKDAIASSVMTQFEWKDISDTLLGKISWTHHLTLLSRTKTAEEREFYLKTCIRENYTVRELNRQISSGLFERTMLNVIQTSQSAKEIPNDLNCFKDNYIFEFLGLPDQHSESDLQKGLIRQMKQFILELGKDFLFVDEEYSIKVGNSDFYIDLLFYHRGLQCLVAFELKADSFKPEYLGKLDFYLEALDRDVKKGNENPSIGILLCKDKDYQVVEYALSRSLSPTMVSEYKTQLPDKKILQRKLDELFK